MWLPYTILLSFIYLVRTILKIVDGMIFIPIRSVMLRLRDDQWERIREHLPEEQIQNTRPGRKPVPPRAILDVVLWILNTGAQWHLLPQCYPNYKTVHRRFQQWTDVSSENDDRLKRE